VELLNDKMVSADRFRSKIEISPDGEDAYFVPVLSSENAAIQANDVASNGTAATIDQPNSVALTASTSSAALQNTPRKERKPSKNGQWGALPPYDCAPHVKPLYVHLPAIASGGSSVDDLQGAAYRGLSNFVAQVMKLSLVHLFHFKKPPLILFLVVYF
jgi:hypothetical protein